jgi:hypothetical protein
MVVIIRREQFAAMEEHAKRSFVARMRQHLRTAFPGRAAGLDQPALDAVIEQGIAASAKYNIRMERHVERYLDAMFLAGFDLDNDPATPWAAVILERKDLEPVVKVELLHMCIRNA